MMPTTSANVRCPVTALKSFVFEGIRMDIGDRLLMPTDQVETAIAQGLVTREATTQGKEPRGLCFIRI